jgi:hypothetical protein
LLDFVFDIEPQIAIQWNRLWQTWANDVSENTGGDRYSGVPHKVD